MNENGDWAPCRLVDLEGQASPRPIGPVGACTSAGWSPNGRWMYFAVTVDGQSHIWRQYFPDRRAGANHALDRTEEDGLAVEPQAPALITSVGVARERTLDARREDIERPLSSEGEVVGGLSHPVFSPDASALYYLLRQGQNSGAELRRTVVESGKERSSATRNFDDRFRSIAGWQTGGVYDRRGGGDDAVVAAFTGGWQLNPPENWMLPARSRTPLWRGGGPSPVPTHGREQKLPGAG